MIQIDVVQTKLQDPCLAVHGIGHLLAVVNEVLCVDAIDM
jgi:hypothetical protein